MLGHADQRVRLKSQFELARRGDVRTLLAAGLLYCILYGLLDEIHQSFVPNRHCDMLDLLADRGLVRAADQTPLEFAHAIAIPEVVGITEKYNSVRFGKKDLTSREREEIENWLGTFRPKS